MLRRLISFILIVTFTLTSVVTPSSAQTLPALPGGPSAISPQSSTLTDLNSTVVFNGIKIYPQEPFRFDFLVDEHNSPQPSLYKKRGSNQLEEGNPPSFSKEGARGSYSQSSQGEYLKLIKYFMASLTVPEGDLWVNLSPYEPDRIVPQALGQTEMGRDLLAQDYILKQLTASLMSPEGEAGKKFWERVYEKIYEQDFPSPLWGGLGRGNSSAEHPHPASPIKGEESSVDDLIESFNKVWIVPNEVEVYQNGDVAYITKATLKVMLESDYLAEQESQSHRVAESQKDFSSNSSKSPSPDVIPAKAGIHFNNENGSRVGARDDNLKSDLTTQENVSRRPTEVPDMRGVKARDDNFDVKDIIRSTIIPLIEDEVNNGESFANLRQIFHSMILAKWYEQHFKNSILGQSYVDRNVVEGIELSDAVEGIKLPVISSEARNLEISQPVGLRNDDSLHDEVINHAPRTPNNASIQDIYNQYLAAFKSGAADIIKEDYDPVTQTVIPRKYFTGGFRYAGEMREASGIFSPAMLVESQRSVSVVFDHAEDVSQAMLASKKSPHQLADNEEYGPYFKALNRALDRQERMIGVLALIIYSVTVVALLGTIYLLTVEKSNRLQRHQEEQDIQHRSLDTAGQNIFVQRPADRDSAMMVTRGDFLDDVPEFKVMTLGRVKMILPSSALDAFFRDTGGDLSQEWRIVFQDGGYRFISPEDLLSRASFWDVTDSGLSDLTKLNLRNELTSLPQGATVLDWGLGKGIAASEIKTRFQQLNVIGFGDVHYPYWSELAGDITIVWATAEDLIRYFNAANRKAGLVYSHYSLVHWVSEFASAEKLAQAFAPLKGILEKDAKIITDMKNAVRRNQLHFVNYLLQAGFYQGGERFVFPMDSAYESFDRPQGQGLSQHYLFKKSPELKLWMMEQVMNILEQGAMMGGVLHQALKSKGCLEKNLTQINVVLLPGNYEDRYLYQIDLNYADGQTYSFVLNSYKLNKRENPGLRVGQEHATLVDLGEDLAVNFLGSHWNVEGLAPDSVFDKDHYVAFAQSLGGDRDLDEFVKKAKNALSTELITVTLGRAIHLYAEAFQKTRARGYQLGGIRPSDISMFYDQAQFFPRINHVPIKTSEVNEALWLTEIKYDLIDSLLEKHELDKTILGDYDFLRVVEEVLGKDFLQEALKNMSGLVAMYQSSGEMSRLSSARTLTASLSDYLSREPKLENEAMMATSVEDLTNMHNRLYGKNGDSLPWGPEKTNQTILSDLLREYLRGLGSRDRIDVLNLGAGNGLGGSLEIAQMNMTLGLNNVIHATHVDISGVGLQQFKDRLSPENLQTSTFKQADLVSFLKNVGDGTFDVVYANLSLQYFDWDTTVKIFKDIRRVLKPGGRLFFRVLSAADLKSQQLPLMDDRSLRDMGRDTHMRFFSEQDIRDVLGSDFEAIQQSTTEEKNFFQTIVMEVQRPADQAMMARTRVKDVVMDAIAGAMISPKGYNFENDISDWQALKGQVIGKKTYSNGTFWLKLKEGFFYCWPILGTSESGWEAKVLDVEVVKTKVILTMELSFHKRRSNDQTRASLAVVRKFTINSDHEKSIARQSDTASNDRLVIHPIDGDDASSSWIPVKIEPLTGLASLKNIIADERAHDFESMKTVIERMLGASIGHVYANGARYIQFEKQVYYRWQMGFNVSHGWDGIIQSVNIARDFLEFQVLLTWKGETKTRRFRIDNQNWTILDNGKTVHSIVKIEFFSDDPSAKVLVFSRSDESGPADAAMMDREKVKKLISFAKALAVISAIMAVSIMIIDTFELSGFWIFPVQFLCVGVLAFMGYRDGLLYGSMPRSKFEKSGSRGKMMLERLVKEGILENVSPMKIELGPKKTVTIVYPYVRLKRKFHLEGQRAYVRRVAVGEIDSLFGRSDEDFERVWALLQKLEADRAMMVDFSLEEKMLKITSAPKIWSGPRRAEVYFNKTIPGYGALLHTDDLLRIKGVIKEHQSFNREDVPPTIISLRHPFVDPVTQEMMTAVQLKRVMFHGQRNLRPHQGGGNASSMFGVDENARLTDVNVLNNSPQGAMTWGEALREFIVTNHLYHHAFFSRYLRVKTPLAIGKFTNVGKFNGEDLGFEILGLTDLSIARGVVSAPFSAFLGETTSRNERIEQSRVRGWMLRVLHDAGVVHGFLHRMNTSIPYDGHKPVVHDLGTGMLKEEYSDEQFLMLRLADVKYVYQRIIDNESGFGQSDVYLNAFMEGYFGGSVEGVDWRASSLNGDWNRLSIDGLPESANIQALKDRMREIMSNPPAESEAYHVYWPQSDVRDTVSAIERAISDVPRLNPGDPAPWNVLMSSDLGLNYLMNYIFNDEGWMEETPQAVAGQAVDEIWRHFLMSDDGAIFSDAEVEMLSGAFEAIVRRAQETVRQPDGLAHLIQRYKDQTRPADAAMMGSSAEDAFQAADVHSKVVFGDVPGAAMEPWRQKQIVNVLNHPMMQTVLSKASKIENVLAAAQTIDVTALAQPDQDKNRYRVHLAFSDGKTYDFVLNSYKQASYASEFFPHGQGAMIKLTHEYLGLKDMGKNAAAQYLGGVWTHDYTKPQQGLDEERYVVFAQSFVSGESLDSYLAHWKDQDQARQALLDVIRVYANAFKKTSRIPHKNAYQLHNIHPANIERISDKWRIVNASGYSPVVDEASWLVDVKSDLIEPLIAQHHLPSDVVTDENLLEILENVLGPSALERAASKIDALIRLYETSGQESKLASARSLKDSLKVRLANNAAMMGGQDVVYHRNLQDVLAKIQAEGFDSVLTSALTEPRFEQLAAFFKPYRAVNAQTLYRLVRDSFDAIPTGEVARFFALTDEDNRVVGQGIEVFKKQKLDRLTVTSYGPGKDPQEFVAVLFALEEAYRDEPNKPSITLVGYERFLSRALNLDSVLRNSVDGFVAQYPEWEGKISYDIRYGNLRDRSLWDQMVESSNMTFWRNTWVADFENDQHKVYGEGRYQGDDLTSLGRLSRDEVGALADRFRQAIANGVLIVQEQTPPQQIDYKNWDSGLIQKRIVIKDGQVISDPAMMVDDFLPAMFEDKNYTFAHRLDVHNAYLKWALAQRGVYGILTAIDVGIGGASGNVFSALLAPTFFEWREFLKYQMTGVINPQFQLLGVDINLELIMAVQGMLNSDFVHIDNIRVVHGGFGTLKTESQKTVGPKVIRSANVFLHYRAVMRTKKDQGVFHEFKQNWLDVVDSLRPGEFFYDVEEFIGMLFRKTDDGRLILEEVSIDAERLFLSQNDFSLHIRDFYMMFSADQFTPLRRAMDFFVQLSYERHWSRDSWQKNLDDRLGSQDFWGSGYRLSFDPSWKFVVIKDFGQYDILRVLRSRDFAVKAGFEDPAMMVKSAANASDATRPNDFKDQDMRMITSDPISVGADVYQIVVEEPWEMVQRARVYLVKNHVFDAEEYPLEWTVNPLDLSDWHHRVFDSYAFDDILKALTNVEGVLDGQKEKQNVATAIEAFRTSVFDRAMLRAQEPVWFNDPSIASSVIRKCVLKDGREAFTAQEQADILAMKGKPLGLSTQVNSAIGLSVAKGISYTWSFLGFFGGKGWSGVVEDVEIGETNRKVIFTVVFRAPEGGGNKMIVGVPLRRRFEIDLDETKLLKNSQGESVVIHPINGEEAGEVRKAWRNPVSNLLGELMFQEAGYDFTRMKDKLDAVVGEAIDVFQNQGSILIRVDTDLYSHWTPGFLGSGGWTGQVTSVTVERDFVEFEVLFQSDSGQKVGRYRIDNQEFKTAKYVSRKGFLGSRIIHAIQKVSLRDRPADKAMLGARANEDSRYTRIDQAYEKRRKEIQSDYEKGLKRLYQQYFLNMGLTFLVFTVIGKFLFVLSWSYAFLGTVVCFGAVYSFILWRRGWKILDDSQGSSDGSDAAMMKQTKAPGGIDFNRLNMKTSGSARTIQMPANATMINGAVAPLKGLVPRIIHVGDIRLGVFLGLDAGGKSADESSGAPRELAAIREES